METCVFLIGGRSAGKTSIGRMLASTLNYAFYDTDDQICARAGRTVTGIVEQDGWPAFRILERQVLQECGILSRTVVATGGGAILHQDIWQSLRNRVFIVWLKASIEILLSRTAADIHSAHLRPALTSQGTEKEFAEIMQQREPLYRQTADLIIDTGLLDRSMIVADIVRGIKSVR